MGSARRARPERQVVALAVVVAAVVVATLGWRLAARAATPPATSTTSTTTTTAAPTTTTTTTVPVGALPQTRALPPAITPALTRRMRALLEGVATGSVVPAIAAFFPVQAYAKTKIYVDAAHDWRTRLIPEFAADLAALHRALDPRGEPLRLLGYAVDEAEATWVLPGEEFNKGPYWRVYDTVVAYGIGSERGSFVVNTMISWRGQWYVVHVANFNG